MVIGEFRLPEALRSLLAQASDCLRLLCSRARSPMPKEERLSLLVLIVVVGFSLAVGYHYAMGYYLGKPWPANTFLFRPWYRFTDFTQVVRQSAGLDPFSVDMGGFAGSPFGQLVGYLFSVIKPSLRLPILFGSFFVAFTLVAKHYLYGLKSRLASNQALTVFVLVFLTYPVLFAADRANLDLLVLPCLFLFAITYARQKYETSTIFLGLAIALKPYAAVLVMVYIFDRRYRDTLLVLFNAVFLTVLSLALFEDGLFAETHKYFTALWQMVSDPSLGSDIVYTSDLYSLLTVVGAPIGDVLHWGSLVRLTDHPEMRQAYTIIAAIVSAYFAIHLWQKPRPLWKTLALLTILIVLLPVNSHDYRLIFLFVPMLMYLATNETTPNDLLIVVLWGLLLVPKDYYHFQSIKNIGMVINPLLLIGLLICIVPDAFSMKGVSSAFRFTYGRLQGLQSIGRIRKLANPRSS